MNRLHAKLPLFGFVLVVATILTEGACGERDQPLVNSELPLGGFRVVASEAVGLNGIENAKRPPIQFMLLGSAERSSSAGEPELVDELAERLRKDSWSLMPHTLPDDWWTIEGNDGLRRVRIGPSSRFVELATIEEGFSRTKFSSYVSEHPGSWIVVSIDPAP